MMNAPAQAQPEETLGQAFRRMRREKQAARQAAEPKIILGAPVEQAAEILRRLRPI